jgi:phospholipid transport system substrate-binding protein
MHRVIGVLLIACASTALSVLPVWAAEPGKLVESVTAKVNEIARTKSGADREAAIGEVLRDNFDLPYMVSSALGTHWNQADVRQRARFLAAFVASEAHAYSERLGSYTGFTIIIGKVIARPNSVWIVDGLLSQASGLPIKLEWEIHDGGQGPRITDVKVTGVSMFVTRRSDFNSYIQNNGGTIEPLIAKLEARAAVH